NRHRIARSFNAEMLDHSGAGFCFLAVAHSKGRAQLRKACHADISSYAVGQIKTRQFAVFCHKSYAFSHSVGRFTYLKRMAFKPDRAAAGFIKAEYAVKYLRASRTHQAVNAKYFSSAHRERNIADFSWQCEISNF